MKIIIALLSFLAFGVLSGDALAQSTPKADKRQRVQQARINQGVRNGTVSKREARELGAQQRHIRRTERRAKADGVVTPAERAKIQRKQNRASRNIRREKTDGNRRRN